MVRVMADGREKIMSVGPIPRRAAGQVAATAADDPDNRPLTSAQLARLRRVPRVKTLRRALGLTQEEFARRYQIPLGTLRDWEQGRTQPDRAARAYLNVIAYDPENVRSALRAAEKRHKPRSNRRPKGRLLVNSERT
jgi:putative transcriptional regulator